MLPLEPIPLVPPDPGMLGIVVLPAPVPLSLMAPLDPVPAVPGVVVEVELDGLLFAADRSSPQPAIANASATAAAMVSSLVISSTLMM